MNTVPEYTGQLLPSTPSQQHLEAATADYEAICYATIKALVERFEAHLERSHNYPFIDTKLDLQSGSNFPANDPVRGHQTIYGWIQGRGLEALVGHIVWLEKHPQPACSKLASRLRAMAQVVLDSLRRLRAANNGHLFFFMKPDGTPFTLGPNNLPETVTLMANTPSNFSDLFGAKGLLAAAYVLDDTSAQDEAEAYVSRVTSDIWDGRFENDQQPLDPTNPIAHVPGRFDHGPFMIHLGTCALGVAVGRSKYIDLGLRLLEHELAHHANLENRIPAFEEGDFWESIDANGAPYRETDGHVLCDPGHALEFVGLALKFGQVVQAAKSTTPAQQERLNAALAPMPVILQRNFDHGFQATPGGICKAYDLMSRRRLNTDMPWWSLPETIRAAALCWQTATTTATQQQCLRIWSACHNAFLAHFIRPKIHLMAVQTRCIDGRVSAAIPATADADPGYHTGLSLLDVIALIKPTTSPKIPL